MAPDATSAYCRIQRYLAAAAYERFSAGGKLVLVNA